MTAVKQFEKQHSTDCPIVQDILVISSQSETALSDQADLSEHWKARDSSSKDSQFSTLTGDADFYPGCYGFSPNDPFHSPFSHTEVLSESQNIPEHDCRIKILLSVKVNLV